MREEGAGMQRQGCENEGEVDVDGYIRERGGSCVIENRAFY